MATTCWIAGSWVRFWRLWLRYSSAYSQNTLLPSRRKATQNPLLQCFSRKPPVSGLHQVCQIPPDFSACLSQSLRSVFAEIIFFSHSIEMWNLPQLFTQSGKFKYSSLIFEDTSSQLRTLKFKNLKSIEKSFFYWTNNNNNNKKPQNIESSEPLSFSPFPAPPYWRTQQNQWKLLCDDLKLSHYYLYALKLPMLMSLNQRALSRAAVPWGIVFSLKKEMVIPRKSCSSKSPRLTVQLNK